MKLLINAITKFICGIILIGLLIFLPAGTIKFPSGWWFLGVLFIPILLLGIFLFLKAPDLLKKRLDSKETESTQKAVVAVSGIMFLLGFIVAGLDFRYSWSKIPNIIKVIATIVFLLSYCIYAEAMRENAYLSRTIEVQKNQRVIDSGLYAVVRHPMYTATVLMFLMIPLILGSWYSFVIFLVYPIAIAIRIKNEEEILTQQLEGYAEYKQKIKYRLIPFIW